MKQTPAWDNFHQSGFTRIRFILFYVFAAFIVLPVSNAAAQKTDVLKEKLLKCSFEQDVIKRLRCYDRIVASI